ncbi:MAG: hypothetical protein JKY48_18375, partial [Flavobacteriales bacterium]|nr:hypothetical protein [Flavobacteriales bacterium]
IKQNTYRIPMIYGDGYILVRYRGVGRILNHLDIDVDGLWVTTNQGIVASYPPGSKIAVTAFEGNDMNYGASMTFVENGKRNIGLTYMDGAMKARQSVRQLNSQEELIVGSAIYDYYGRPAIGVMGSPVKETQLGYVENLNMFNASTPYDKAVFHQDNLLFEDCFAKPAAPMDPINSKGSANYYSQQNTNKEGAEAFVPEANGYNFTQIHYTNDATGRIKRAGSVGADHQLDGIGEQHYTETIFDTPDDREVDSLLGSEAADVVNYTKVITKDVHGQVSVAIIDNMGRSVISYLEGSAPDGLDAIEGNVGLLPVVVDLLGLTSESTDLLEQGILQVEKKIAVTDPSVIYTFNYDFSSLSFTNCLPPDICFDCIYEVEFEVTSAEAELSGACGLTDGENPIPSTWSHTLGSVEFFDITCDDPLIFSEAHPTSSTFTLKFPAFGAYYIKKTLKVSQAPIEFYWEQYVENADESCIIPYENFLANAMMDIDFGDCYDGSPCELNFLYTFGTWEQYALETGETDESVYNSMHDAYIIDCENQPICAQMRPILLADVSPGGQYGDISGSGGLSVFNDSDPMSYSWRDVINFLDLDGDPVMTTDVDGGPIKVNDASIGLSEFIAEYWEPYFAEQLLGAHPEYETYRFCELYPDVFDYALEFKLTETYAEALASGFLSPVNTDPNPIINPYADCFMGSPATYSSSLADPLVLLIEGVLNTALSSPSYIYDDSYIVPTNSYLDACHGIFGTSLGATFYQMASAMTDGAAFGSSSCDVDAQWIAFRDLYLARRNILLQVAMEGRAMDIPGNAYIRCILYEHGICVTDSYTAYNSKLKLFLLYDQMMSYPLIQLLEGDAAAYAAMEAEAEADVEGFCAAACESMAESWMLELEDCAGAMLPLGQVWESGDDPINSFYENLKAELIEVCKGGCSPEFPFPSQYNNNLSPVPAYLTSFQAVIEHHLGTAETMDCNHYLIDFPSAARPVSMSDTLDECACDKLLFVADEEAFEVEYGFVPINFCRDREICANAAGVSPSFTYTPLGVINWTISQLAILEDKITPTNYGCNGDGCID